MTKVRLSAGDGNNPLRPSTSTNPSQANDPDSSGPSSETLSLVHEWKATIEACLKKLSGEEQKKVEDFTLASLEAWLREDFAERKLPPEMTAGILEQVRPFFEHADKLDQKLQDALKLPGQPEQIRSELLDGGAYLVLRNGAMNQLAVKQALVLLRQILKNITQFEGSLKSKPLDRCTRPLTDFCIAMVHLWSATVGLFSRHSSDINILSSKVGDALRKARESMAEAEAHIAFIVQLSEELVDGNLLPSFVHLNTSEPDPVWMPVQSLQHDVFQGRDDKLSEIEKFFAEAVHNDAPGPLVAMIYGMGGVGKTTLATEYYRKWQFKSRYRYGLWVNAETKASIAESFHEVARALDLQISNGQDAQLSVLTWLNSEVNANSWLLVFDNVQDIAMFQKIIPVRPGHIVVTTRFSFRLSKYQTFRLQKLDEEQSLDLFNAFRSKYDPDADIVAEENDTRKLLERIDGLPLAIKLGASFIGSNGWAVKDFLDEYAVYEQNFLEEADEFSPALNATWEIPFKELGKHHPNASKLFGLMCLMNAIDIPMNDFHVRDMAIDEEYDFLEDKSKLLSARKELQRMGLIELESGKASVHRVLSAAFRNSKSGLKSRPVLQSAAEIVAKILNRQFPKHVGNRALFDHWAHCSKYMNHVQALVRHFKESEMKSTRKNPTKLESSNDMDELMKDCCWYLVEAGKAEEALELLKFASEISINKESVEYATLCQGYAATSFQLNRLQDCRLWNERCLQIRQLHMEENNPDIANCRANLANLLTAEGRFDEARQQLTLALQPMSEDRESDRTYLGTRYMMMGRTYLRAGDLATADRWYVKSRKVLAKAGTGGQFMLWFLALDLGNLDMACGLISDAVEKFRTARDQVKEKTSTHPLVGVLTYKTCLAYFRLNDYKSARDGLEDALERARYDSQAGTWKQRGQEPRVLKLMAQTFAQDPEATAEERASALELEAKAAKLKDELAQVNKGMVINKPQTEQEEYDSLLCGYYR